MVQLINYQSIQLVNSFSLPSLIDTRFFDRGEQTTDGPKDVLGHLCCYMDCAPAMRKYPVCRHFVKGTV